MTKVRLWQVESDAAESPAARLERVLAGLPEMAAGVEVLVLPELWVPGAFNLAAAAGQRFTFTSEPIQHMAEVARVNQIWLHAGSFAIADPADPAKSHNTSLVFGPDGELAGSYRKQHLFGFAEGERLLMNPSDDLVVLPTALGRTGLATCYDLRFPEMFRALTSRGAESFLLTSGWPSTRVGHWRVLVAARAIECQAVMVACNGRGSHSGVTLAGESMVISARGEVLAHAAATDEFCDAEVDMADVPAWRDEFPALLDRRIW